MRGNFITNRSGKLNPNYKHGLKNTRIYRIYHNMLSRCYNSHMVAYSRYGARGITVCDEWKNDFKSFYDWSISHGYQDNLTIDRIDNDGNYEPNNCRWTTCKTQSNNTSRCKYIIINGESKTVREWCEITGVNYSTAQDRMRRCRWDPIKAVTTPPNPKFRKKVMPC